ncbi:tRNA pseudouridine(38-40) synthase TruA [candidate division NPL-UPA2 bacterium]|nr:tRNA pseudouridine(38-40) synthase TruA [candidate division NPL-UPA2 bacterium]
MRNIKLALEYDGENYHGWQRQPRVVTIQGMIEEALAKILQEKVNLIGSGRTDAGVHARGQIANFKTKSYIPLKNLKAALNSLLPGDIIARRVALVSDDFHARYHAKSKIYCYTILNSPLLSPFSRKYAYFFPHSLDITAMKRAAKFLVGEHDFSSFRGTGTARENCLRKMKGLRISTEKELVLLNMEANGFLYNMVRIIAGTLLEVGRGKIAAGEVKRILGAKDRRQAGPTLSAQGLCLLRVKYR